MIERQQGRPATAELVQEARRVDPRQARVHYNLGNAPAALAAYKASLQLDAVTEPLDEEGEKLSRLSSPRLWDYRLALSRPTGIASKCRDKSTHRYRRRKAQSMQPDGLPATAFEHYTAFAWH